MSMETSETVVADALSKAVRELGTRIGEDPRRVQACLNDDLAEASRSHRAEIDAVVLAAEESVPTEMTSGSFDRPSAMQRLRERGLSDDIAMFSIDVWHHSLGLNAPGTSAPTLSSPAASTSLPDPAADGLVIDISDRTVHPAAMPMTVATASDRLAPARSRRTMYTVVGGVVAVGVVIALLFTVLGSDGGTVKTPGPAATSLRFDPEKLSWGPSLTRMWIATDKGIRGDLVFKNESKDAVSGTYVEAIPKSLATDATKIKATPTPKVLNPDPVVEFAVKVAPSATTTISYTIATSTKVTGAQLATWRTEQAAALKEFNAPTDTTAPPVAMTSAPSGTVVGGSATDLTGSSEPGTSVDVNGSPASVNPDGTWTFHADLTPGSNVFTIIAKDAAGNPSAPLAHTIIYFSPGPVAPTVTKPPTTVKKTTIPLTTPTTPTTPTPTGEPTTPTTPTVAPTPSPTIYITGPASPMCLIPGNYTFTSHTTNANSVVWTSVSTQPTAFSYTIHFSGSGDTTVRATAYGDGGTASDSMAVHILADGEGCVG